MILTPHALKSLKRRICRHFEDVIILRSSGGAYDPKTMRYHGNGREEIKIQMALFKNTGAENSIKNAVVHEADGKRVEYDLKIYKNTELYLDDKVDYNQTDQADIIVWENKHYIVRFLDYRHTRGKKCNGVTILYASLYEGERIEK